MGNYGPRWTVEDQCAQLADARQLKSEYRKAEQVLDFLEWDAFERDLAENGVARWFWVECMYPGMTRGRLLLAKKHGRDRIIYRPKLLRVAFNQSEVFIETWWFDCRYEDFSAETHYYLSEELDLDPFRLHEVDDKKIAYLEAASPQES